MSVTILGQHISLIRPKRIKKPKVYKNELPVIKYNRRTKTIKKHSGHVVAVCVMVKGKIFEIAKGLHFNVLETFNLNPLDVTKTGWKLENGNYIWR